MGGACTTMLEGLKKRGKKEEKPTVKTEPEEEEVKITQPEVEDEEKTFKSLIKDIPLEFDDKLIEIISKRYGKKRKKKGRGSDEDEMYDEEMGKEEGHEKRLQILKLLDRIDKWDFDIFKFSRLTKYNPLLYVAYVLILKYDCIKKINTPEKVLINFLKEICKGYNNSSALTNSTFACNILQSFGYLLKKGLSDYLCDEDILVGIICCCLFFYQHPLNLTNFFMKNNSGFSSTLYNDDNILQNCALCSFFELIETSKFNIFKNCSKEQRKYVRTHLIETLLCYPHSYQNEAGEDTFLSNGEIAKNLKNIKKSLDDGADFSSKEDIKVLLQVSVIFSNYSFCLRPKKFFLKWVKQMLYQYYVEGKASERTELPKNNYFKNLDNVDVEVKNFMDKKVWTTLKIITRVLPSMKFLTTLFKKNKNYFITSPTVSTSTAAVTEEQVKEDPFLKYKGDILNSVTEDVVSKSINDVKKLDSRLKSNFGFPEDRKMNVSLSEQKKLIPYPTQKQIDNEKYCLSYLIKRWSVENNEKREILTKEPKIYSKNDFSDDQELSDEEIRYSIIVMFERIDEWNFDVFALTDLLGNDGLFITSYVLFVKYDLLNRFKIDKKIFVNFLNSVRDNYYRNPYHNVMHACDVMQVTNSIIKKGGMISRLSQIDLMASIVSSMVHDLGHPGFNDAFQVHSYSYLARLYNDRSVLEAHHCSKSFMLMREEGMDIMQNMTFEEKMDCRKTMIEMIISTDMSNHAKYVNAFNELIEKESKFDDKRHLRTALQIVIKMADISNPSRPLYIYLQWTKFIIHEFYRQGDAEKKYGLPISPLMDRETSVLSKGQKAFMEYVIIPMFKSFSNTFKGARYMVDGVVQNIKYWKENEEIKPEYFDPALMNDRLKQENISKIAVESNRKNLYISTE